MGLEAGADDYLVKPFEYSRARSAHQGAAAALAEGHVGRADAGPASRSISRRRVVALWTATPVELTAFEYRLLEYLVRERARVATKQELSDYLYPHDEDRDSNVLEVLIGRLRRKLDPRRHPGADRDRCADGATGSPSDEVARLDTAPA